jgi:hypothetical protein
MNEGDTEVAGTTEEGVQSLLAQIMLGSVKLSPYSMKMLERELERKHRKRRKCGNKRARKRRTQRQSYQRVRDSKITRVLEYKYTFKGRYVRMKADAKHNGAEWNLSPRDWATLWLKVREATGRMKPWTYKDYKFVRRDKAKPIELGNLTIHIRSTQSEVPA